MNRVTSDFTFVVDDVWTVDQKGVSNVLSHLAIVYFPLLLFLFLLLLLLLLLLFVLSHF